MENQVIPYRPNEAVKVDVLFEQDTVWLTQAQLCDLFQRDVSVISRHIRNVFAEGELEEKGNLQKMQIASSDRPVAFYSLDVIISVGYRVKSVQGTRFRIWATRVLREMLLSRCDEIRRLDKLEHRVGDVEREVSQVKSGMNYLVKQITTPPKPPKRRPIGYHV